MVSCFRYFQGWRPPHEFTHLDLGGQIASGEHTFCPANTSALQLLRNGGGCVRQAGRGRGRGEGGAGAATRGEGDKGLPRQHWRRGQLPPLPLRSEALCHNTPHRPRAKDSQVCARGDVETTSKKARPPRLGRRCRVDTSPPTREGSQNGERKLQGLHNVRKIAFAVGLVRPIGGWSRRQARGIGYCHTT